MDTKKLWDMYEESVIKEEHLNKKSDNEKNGLSLIESTTQNGVSQGILKCLEELEEDKKKVWSKAHKIYCRAKGIDLENGFGIWIPVEDELPNKDSLVLACFDGGFITSVEYIDDWQLWVDSGEVVAWMPLPKPYKD